MYAVLKELGGGIKYVFDFDFPLDFPSFNTFSFESI